ncbi:MAG TPA: hypothetical protein VFK40_04365, partial [Nitrososphaeraceae archaeon]|nr:hypothetical protein [Nitrososphaeraceae archaeon]
MLRYLGIFLLLAVSFLSLSIILSSPLQIAIGAKNTITITNGDVDEKEKLVVLSNINLANISKTGIIKMVGAINGEEFMKDIPLTDIDEKTKKLKVKFVMNKENEFVSAGSRDEFFVCAYQYTNVNNPTSITFDKKDTIEYFDCDEGDLAGSGNTTIARLFNAKSLVYDKTQSYYEMHSKPNQVVSFATLGNDTDWNSETGDINASNVPLHNTEIEPYTKEISYVKNENKDIDKPVKVKILIPMEDRKDAKKLKIIAMLKGQIKSEIINNVQKEFDKTGKYTISRTFVFDRNTDMGPIQVGDRFHACVIGEDLNP